MAEPKKPISSQAKVAYAVACLSLVLAVGSGITALRSAVVDPLADVLLRIAIDRNSSDLLYGDISHSCGADAHQIIRDDRLRNREIIRLFMNKTKL